VFGLLFFAFSPLPICPKFSLVLCRRSLEASEAMVLSDPVDPLDARRRFARFLVDVLSVLSSPVRDAVERASCRAAAATVAAALPVAATAVEAEAEWLAAAAALFMAAAVHVVAAEWLATAVELSDEPAVWLAADWLAAAAVVVDICSSITVTSGLMGEIRWASAIVLCDGPALATGAADVPPLPAVWAVV